jgi:hypothetical protein
LEFSLLIFFVQSLVDLLLQYSISCLLIKRNTQV